MLQELFIKDFALIKNLRIAFGAHLNIITGETGAGKSIVLGALSLILGAKATTDLIRSGAKRAIVEAVFVPQEKNHELFALLKERGLDSDEEDLILKREISVEGKGRSFINSQQVPVNLLKEVGSFLIDIHGQNEHQNIVHTKTHRIILDRFSKSELLCRQLQELYKKNEDSKQKLSSVSLNERDKNHRLEILQYEIEEIEKADLKDARELDELIQKEQSLDNAESIMKDLSSLYNGLSDDDVSVLKQLAQLERLLENNISFDAELSNLLDNFHEAQIILEELSSALRSKAERINLDPEELQITKERIDVLQGIYRKYGPAFEDILSTLEKNKNELTGIELSDEEASRLKQLIEKLELQLKSSAAELSNMRKAGAKILEQSVKEELAFLGMADTQIRVSMKWELSPQGIFEREQKLYNIFPFGLDIIEFLMAPSANETLRPMRKIASGGEMSRIMLALKMVLNKSDPVETMIFDEVDAGVGGAIADKIGQKLLTLSKEAQVIVITHLHQIASLNQKEMQTRHFKVSKDVEQGSKIVRLEKEERVKELARMLGGEKISEQALQHARSLLDGN